jgi:hypothetical protein
LSTCPACGKDVRPVWPSCRACGALLMPAPAPLAQVGAAVGAPDTGAPSAEEQFFAPAVMQPVVNIAPASASASYAPSSRRVGSGASASASASAGTGKWIMLIGMVVFVIAAIGCAAFVIKPNAVAEHQTPEVLAPRAPTAGLPTSLATIVRVRAESTRRTALQTVEQVGSADIGQLTNLQPSYTWVAGTSPSTDSAVISVAQNPGSVTIAVAASNHDVCAFGQWSSDGTVRYVTMAHETECAAVNAPSIGWSSEAGGAASDLPDNIG